MEGPLLRLLLHSYVGRLGALCFFVFAHSSILQHGAWASHCRVVSGQLHSLLSSWAMCSNRQEVEDAGMGPETGAVSLLLYFIGEGSTEPPQIQEKGTQILGLDGRVLKKLRLSSFTKPIAFFRMTLLENFSGDL